MRAIAIDQFGGVETLKVVSLPEPKPKADEIRIRVIAAGVNPVDWKIREGLLKDLFPHHFPLVLGWDVAGIVDAVGSNAKRFKIGDAVYSYVRKPEVQWGAYAEYVTITEDVVAHKPKSLLFFEAAAVPLAALTAYQALFDKPTLKAGQTVLIHAAAGGVGHFAVQLAKYSGATVIATVGPDNLEFVRQLGADHIIDYRSQDFVQATRALYPDGIDLVFDTMAGEVQTKSFDVLKTNGHMVSILVPPDEQLATAKQVTGRHVFVSGNGEQLKTLTELFDNGKLQVHISKLYGLNNAAQALQANQAGHTRGKAVLIL